jgi:hypothetical protein
MNILIMQFSPASCHFYSIGSKYSLQHPVLKIISPCSSPNKRAYVSHPYRTARYIIVLITAFGTTDHQETKVFQLFVTRDLCYPFTGLGIHGSDIVHLGPLLAGD